MKRRIVKISLMLALIMMMSIPVMATNIYPALSYNTFIQPAQEIFLISHMDRSTAENYTIICRNNGTDVYLKISFFTAEGLDTTKVFNVYNFTIFSFKLKENITYFHVKGNNTGDTQIKIYLDVYLQAIEDLQGDTLILFPIDNPVIEYVEIIEYIPIMVRYNVTWYVTEYVNVTVTKYVDRIHTEYIIEMIPAILVSVGGVSVLIVYIAIREKQKKDKPINKMTVDELFDEFRKG